MFDEWHRPPRADLRPEESASHRASPRLLSVVLFWSHVEVLLERTWPCAARHLFTPVREDLFRRYAGIGVRMGRLAGLLIGCCIDAL